MSGLETERWKHIISNRRGWLRDKSESEEEPSTHGTACAELLRLGNNPRLCSAHG